MSNNKFSYLLNLLKISPSQMAEYLNVDRTLVSKWKNGTRTISINSDYFDKALEFLILKNETLNAKLLENLLSSIYPDLNNEVNHNLYLMNHLKNYILNDNNDNKISKTNETIAPNSIYSASVPIYSSEENMLLGILNMLDSVINDGIPQKLIFIFNDTLDLLMDYDNFRNKWLEKVLTLLNMGCKLRLAYTIGNSSKLFIYLSSLIFHKNCSILSYMNSSNYDSKKTSFHIIEDRKIFLSIYHCEERNLYSYGAIFFDPVSIDFYTKIAEDIISKAKPTLYKLNAYTLYDTLFRQINIQANEIFANHHTIYYYDKIPTIYPTISEDLFYEILCNSIQSKDTIKKEFDLFKKINQYIKDHYYKNERKHFYPIDSLIKMADMDTIVYREALNQFPKLVVSNSQFKRHMKELADYLLSNEKFNICLCPTTLIPSAPSVHCWCKKNERLIIFDDNYISQVKMCSDASFTNSVCNLLEHQFLCAPENLKSKTIVADFLRSL